MAPDLDKRKELGACVKAMLAKYGIRQTEVAAKLGITRQYVCQICAGKSPLAPEHFKTIYDYLTEMKADEKDLNHFVHLHVNSKIMIPFTAEISLDKTESELLHMFRELDAPHKEEVLGFVRKIYQPVANSNPAEPMPGGPSNGSPVGQTNGQPGGHSSSTGNQFNGQPGGQSNGQPGGQSNGQPGGSSNNTGNQSNGQPGGQSNTGNQSNGQPGSSSNNTGIQSNGQPGGKSNGQPGGSSNNTGNQSNGQPGGQSNNTGNQSNGQPGGMSQS